MADAILRSGSSVLKENILVLVSVSMGGRLVTLAEPLISQPHVNARAPD